MLIDWFTVAAQIVNFLILVYLLKRFLYQPILSHMRKREDKIRGSLQEAAAKEAAAEKQIEVYRRKEEQLENQRADKLRQAEEEGEEQQQKMLEDAKEEVENARRRWLEALDREKRAFGRDLKQRSCREVLELTRRALRDLADESLNNRLAAILLQRVDQLEKQDRDKLTRAGCEDGITVRSSFALEVQEKRQITTAFHRICGKQTEVAYQVDEDYPLGIEASTGSIRLAWNIEGYLDELQQKVMDFLEENGPEFGEAQSPEDQAEPQDAPIQGEGEQNQPEPSKRESDHRDDIRHPE